MICHRQGINMILSTGGIKMKNLSELKTAYDNLIDLLTAVTKQAAANTSADDIANTFKAEFMFYAGALTLCDGEIADEELETLSAVFEYPFDHAKVVQAARGFADTMNEIPMSLIIACGIDNDAAENKELPLLSFYVVSMFANIAKAVVSADEQLHEDELKLTVGYVNILSEFMNKTLSDAAKAKMPKE